ncbi:hypothetical protein [Thiovibrio frasassiensis]|uniref:Uncharacterized protein n=1 Tax=Thiovibrio frasassiensis TaxID=2984131 RepID=A0A9X4MFE8_9BACT|nr:hypothetical protein [Thiovibrio frasassiensis]MDG4475647.1 hypothetical protein [Thiovibrio frasassiensis]
MVLPERSFYKLTELAEHWGIGEDILLDWGKQGRLKFWFYYHGSVINKYITISKYGVDTFNNSRKVIRLSNKYCRDFCGPIKLFTSNITDLIFLKTIEIDSVIMNKTEWIFSERLDDEGLYKFNTIILSKSELIVMNREAVRMENKYQELAERPVKMTTQPRSQETSSSQDNKLINQSNEAEEAMVKQLKEAGMTDKAIAQELKRAFPKINPSRIGRLITGNGSIVTTDAFRKRGERLLK